MWSLSLGRLRAQKFRLISTSLSVLIGVAFLSGSMVLIDTLGESFDDLVVDINEGVDVVVRSSETLESGFTEVRARIDESLIDDIRKIPGVAAAEPSIDGYAQLVDKTGDAIGNPQQGAPTIGFNWADTEALNQMTIVEGDPPNSPSEIVIDRFTAQSNDLNVGDAVTVLLHVPPEEFVISGIAVFGESDSLMGASITLFTYDTAQRVLGAPGEISSISVVAESSVTQSELRARIAASLPVNVEALTGEQTVAEMQSDISEALSFFNTFMTIFALIALFVASFIIYNTFSILVAQRTRETALLRALGARRRQVIGAVLIEALTVGLIASTLGVIAGLGVAELLKQALAGLGFDLPADGVVFQPSTAYYALIVGITITTISAVVPAVRASRTAPLAALRQASVDNSALSRPRLIFGTLTLASCIVLLLVGLFTSTSQRMALIGVGAAGVFIGVAALGPIAARPFARIVGAPIAKLRGLPGELARENSMRNPRRTATTAAALMVGVGLVSAISIFAASTTESVEKIIDESVVGDLVVDSGSQGFGGFSPSLASEINALEEVDVASGVRIVLAEIDGDSEALLAFDTQVMDQLTDVAVVQGDPKDLGVDGLAVLATEAEERGWTIGSPVTLHFVDTGDQRFVIESIYEEDQLVGPMFISNEAFAANSKVVFDIAVYVNSNPDFAKADVRAAVDQTAAPYPNADVMDLAELKDSVRDQVNQMLNLVYALLALAVLIALMGIANTLALSVVERTREIGLIRALGMTRAQLRASVRWESFLISLLGATMGLAVGGFFGWVMVRALQDEGITEFTVPPTQIAAVVVLAAAAGVVASIRPAAKAAKLPILDAMATT